MRLITLLLAAIMLIIIATAAISATVTYTAADGSTVVISAASIDVGSSFAQYVLTGQAHVKTFNKTTKTNMDASADKIIANLFATPGDKNAKSNQGVIKSAELIGSPKLIYQTLDPDTGKIVTSTATSKAATFDGKQQIAYLEGNVRVENENPALFQGPAIITGDKVTVNLRPDIGPNEPRFKIESNEGISKIEAIAKPKEEAQK